jgi:DNA-binding response OmpR family regulator
MARSQFVLIVEDDQETKEMVAYSLVLQGCNVQTASNRDTALQMMKSNRVPDILLLDYSMPGMPADKFIKELLEISPKPPRIVMMTAAREADHRARELGVPEVLKKPFDLNDLLARIEPCDAQAS